MNHTDSDNRGVVALITSIIVGLLLIVITLSGVRIMGGELGQASDFDQSVKAYFAAESGLEDAIAYVRRNMPNLPQINNCGPATPAESNLSGDSNRTVAYTCQTIRTENTQVIGELKKEQSVQINLSGLQFNRLVISWNQEGTTDPSGWQTGSIPIQFPPGNNWSDAYPAVLETGLVSYNRGGFGAANIEHKAVVLKPHPNGDENPRFNLQNVGKLENVRCLNSTAATSYECQATLEIPPANNNYILRLHARYSSTHYKIELFQGACGVACRVDVPNSQLVIDVTGKAGDVYRRIQARSFFKQTSPLPFAILTDQDICKVQEVLGGQASNETGCQP